MGKAQKKPVSVRKNFFVESMEVETKFVTSSARLSDVEKPVASNRGRCGLNSTSSVGLPKTTQLQLRLRAPDLKKFQSYSLNKLAPGVYNLLVHYRQNINNSSAEKS